MHAALYYKALLSLKTDKRNQIPCLATSFHPPHTFPSPPVRAYKRRLNQDGNLHLIFIFPRSHVDPFSSLHPGERCNSVPRRHCKDMITARLYISFCSEISISDVWCIFSYSSLLYPPEIDRQRSADNHLLGVWSKQAAKVGKFYNKRWWFYQMAHVTDIVI